MPLQSLPCEYLFTLRAFTAADAPALTIPDGPQGTRLVVTLAGGTFEGPRIRGQLGNVAAGDWATARDDGSFRLDVRIVLVTDDGAAILMSYCGVGEPDEGSFVLHSAPTFETGDERYTWLNRVQAVGIGRTDDDGVTYEIYALN